MKHMNQNNSKIDISVIIPVKNEAINLRRCLPRLNDFKEVIVIDSHSTDETANVANSFGAQVIQFNWDGSYPKKRNWFLLNYSTKSEWVLFLDADELVTEEFKAEIKKLRPNDLLSGYWIEYHNFFLKKRLRFGIPQRKLALFRNKEIFYERINEKKWSPLDMEIHEHPVIHEKVGVLKSRIIHADSSGFGKYASKHVDYAMWEANRFLELSKKDKLPDHFTKRQLFKYKNLNKIWYPILYFFVQYFLKLGFLDGSAGFYFAVQKMIYFFHIKLLILELKMKECEI